MNIVMATNNPNKLSEIQQMIAGKIKILKLSEINLEGDIPETSDTLEGNAIQKANFIHEKCRLNCIADDTGLEVEALNGRPGVYSARYAGESCSSEDNMEKLLNELKGTTNRKARFRTVIASIINGEQRVFEGMVEGEITMVRKGEQGFGYDPIFQPTGYEESFAQMDMSLKNSISHRGRALRKFVEYLNVKSNVK